MTILPLFIIIPLAGAFITSIFNLKSRDNSIRAVNIFVFIISLLLFALSVFIIGKSGVYNMGGWRIPLGIILVLDGFSAPLLLITNFISLICILFSFDYMSKESGREKYYALFLLMVAGINGVLLTGDIFNLYVFLEVASIASYALVGFGTGKKELEATFKYMILSRSMGTAFMLLGIAFLYGYTRNLNMVYIAKILAETGMNPGIYLALGLFVIGFSIKSALIPFHAWLPDAHSSAPSPISAMLSGVLIKTIGIYALVRIGYIVFGMNTGILPAILRNLGVLSVIVGVLLALGQWDFKRLLAYHSISQMGYIAIGFGLATPLGIAGGLFHLLNHSVFKALLFLNAGSVYYRTGERNLKKMGGLNSKMPVTGTTSMIASLSISGVPPFSGFWSKLIIIIACFQANSPWLAFWAIIGSILTLASFLKVQRYAFMGKIKSNFKEIKESPLLMQIPMIILAVLSTVMGLILLPSIREVILEPAADILLNPSLYINMLLRK